MQDEANLKDDANPYAAPSIDSIQVQVANREIENPRRGWMAFAAYFCTAIAGGIFGLPLGHAIGLIVGFIWAGVVGTAPFLVMAFLARSKASDNLFRAGLGLSGALTGFACVCIPFTSALWNQYAIPSESLVALAVAALAAAVLGGIGSVFGSFLVPRA